MHGLKALLGSAALLIGVAMAPAAHAQVSIGINIGGPPPACPYGYYETPPYACAPMGYYGPGYFYNGIFLGVGPWAGWGYAHGWGHHRFVAPGGGRYHGRAGYMANHGHFVHGYDDRTHGASHSAPAPHRAPAPRSGHPTASRSSGHSTASHGGHPTASHSSGHSTASHGSAEHHGGAAHSDDEKKK
jgi:hypothetical protein